jgi:hypothetical protein
MRIATIAAATIGAVTADTRNASATSNARLRDRRERGADADERPLRSSPSRV